MGTPYGSPLIGHQDAMKTPVPPPPAKAGATTEVVFTATWKGVPVERARPWVQHMHNLWHNQVTKQSLAGLMNASISAVPGYQPDVSLEMVQRYENGWVLSGGEIRECMRALQQAIGLLEDYCPNHDKATAELWSKLSNTLEARLSTPPAIKADNPEEL